MNINLNFGEHYYEGGGSFLTSVLISFIGAFLGLLSALLVNRIIEKKGKKNQNKIKNSLDLEHIHYLGIVLKSTLKNAKEQIIHYHNYADLVKKNPLQIYLPILLTSSDAWRLRNLDSKELFESYKNVFKDMKNVSQEYKNIFVYGDYILELFNEIKKQNKLQKDTQQKDEIFVLGCIEEIFMRIGLRSKNIQITNGDKASEIPEFNYLRKFEGIYTKVSEGVADFAKLRDEYLKPLHDSILSNISEPNFADYIFTVIKKALGRLQYIEFNALGFAKDMENLENDTKDAIEILDKQLEIIEKKIE